MDNLRIDLESMLPTIIDAFTKVYGEEYYDIISERINNVTIIQYYNIERLRQYIDDIKKTKRREYAIKFLDKIGVNVNIKDNYRQPLDSEIEELLSYYIFSSYTGFGKNTDEYVPIQAFKTNNDTNPRVLLKNKIKIINYLLGDNYKQINEENFDSFTETEEYNKILKKINELNLVYEQLLLEYRNWEEQLHPYEELVNSEEQRELEILEKKKRELFLDIYPRLPNSVKNAISDKSLEEKISTILGLSDIGSTSDIEMFGFKAMEQLKSKEILLDEKYYIILAQKHYLRKIGIEFPNKKILLCNSEEDVNAFLNFLNQENIKKYLPSDDLVNYINSLRQDKYEEAIKEYYTTKNDFLIAKKQYSETDFIYGIMKYENTCVCNIECATKDVLLMFYQISSICGSLFWGFTHECGHAIDQNGTGFDDFLEVSERNPYDDNYRKYEKFNETLNDIFTMEVIDLLHNQGIYLIEPLEFTLLDVSNLNTALITKNLLKPLVSKFREQVIASKINSNRYELMSYIGVDNFEELVDVVNKVDYLARNGVANKINESPDDEMVKEYFKQVERAKEIYIDIDNYYNVLIEPYAEPKKNK